jgi:hypothetical protein
MKSPVFFLFLIWLKNYPAVIKRLLFFLLLLFAYIPVRSQYFSTGQDPASIRWRQIKTPQYRIIFPESFGSQSQYLANILDLVCPAETNTLKSHVPRIPLLIHTRSATSNGVTSWAPKRIELYPCPPQDSYAEEWLEQLVIHEYRHTVQISKMNQGFSKALYYIFGEQATGAILGLFIPSWFLEGDAVSMETALTNTGRGRNYVFENVLRAQLLEKGAYPYDKEVLGSYRTFIPDQYELGYPLVAQARKEYGAEFWNTPLDRSAKLPFMVVPFSSGIHKETGLTKVRFYKKMMEDLRQEWQAQDDSVAKTGLREITRRDPKNFCSYISPVLLNDSSIIAIKESLEDPDRIVRVDRKTGSEKNILTIGASADEILSVAGDLLVWAEYHPGPRWQNEDYSVLRAYRFSTGEVRTLTRRSFYFAPSISPDCTEIAAVRIDEGMRCFIDILTSDTGRVLATYPLQDHTQALMPDWSTDGSALVFIRLDENGKHLSLLDLKTGKIRDIFTSGFTEMSAPTFLNDQQICFTADYSGIENIFVLDTLTGRVFMTSSARFSAAAPDITRDGKTMVYSDYCSDGFRIVEAPVAPDTWVSLEKVRDRNIKLYKPLVLQEHVNLQDSIRNRHLFRMMRDSVNNEPGLLLHDKIYPVRKYSKILNLFNPHSWAPASFNVDNMILHPGVMVLSQNVLSTAQASTGYDYDYNEGTGKFFLNLTYAGLYPVLDLGFSIGNRASYATEEPGGEQVRFIWQETNLTAALSIPWNFSSGACYRYLTPSFGTTLINSRHLASTPENFTSGLIESLDYGLRFSQYFRAVDRDIYPRWAQVLEATFRNTPFSKNNLGSIFETELTLYFPGPLPHHSLWCYGGVQARNEPALNGYRFSDIITVPRGYTALYDQTIYSLSLNYTFPLFCPDWSAGSVLYFKRFKMNLFFDYAEGYHGDALNIYRSTGAELTADLHILRFLYPFELGLRTIYLPGNSSWKFEFLYAVKL